MPHCFVFTAEREVYEGQDFRGLESFVKINC
jgi:hypothetical protein